MSIFLDAENASGIKQGKGALRPVAWKWTAKLDGAGSVEAKIPALDPQIGLVVSKATLRAKGQYYSGAVLSDFGAGVIDSIATTAAGQNGIVTAGGFDLLYELTTKLVGNLLLSDGAGGPQSAGTILASLLTNAPAGWTSSGTPSRAVYQQFKNETILTALSKMAEQTGDHFRLGSGRQVVWIAAGTFTASGVRAENSGAPVTLEGNTALCSIMSVTETADTHDVFSRIYPYGAGSGDARLTIAGINTSGRPLAGYTHNIATAPYYIEKTATTTAYGLIEREEDFNDIGAAETTSGTAAANAQSAANALYDAAVRKLALAANPQKAYKVNITGLEQALNPGTTIRVVFRGYAIDDEGNPLRWLNLNTDLFILSVTHDFDAHGLRKSTLEVTATVTDQWPKTEASDALALKDQVRALSQYRQPTTQAAVSGTYQAAWAVQTGAGAVFAAYADGNPVLLAALMSSNSAAAVTATNIGTTAARAVRFRLPRTLALSAVKVFAIGSTTGIFTFAIYSAAGVQMWTSGAQNTTANAWLSMTPVSVTLAANTDYWFCIATTAANATSAFRSLPTPLNTAHYGADNGPLSALSIGIGEMVEFACTAGSWPGSLPALAAEASWTGSIPHPVLVGTAS